MLVSWQFSPPSKVFLLPLTIAHNREREVVTAVPTNVSKISNEERLHTYILRFMILMLILPKSRRLLWLTDCCIINWSLYPISDTREGTAIENFTVKYSGSPGGGTTRTYALETPVKANFLITNTYTLSSSKASVMYITVVSPSCFIHRKKKKMASFFFALGVHPWRMRMPNFSYLLFALSLTLLFAAHLVSGCIICILYDSFSLSAVASTIINSRNLSV